MSYQHNQKFNGPGPIPNRWLYCPRKSETVLAEHFIAFKTPLSKAFNDQMPLECLFSPEMMFDYCQTLKLKLGLWIDLTNTKRFYDRKVIEERGAQYVKLQCRGHGETPSMEQTRSFIEIVGNFINERPFDIIGVHCTHGFNRTGFLICSYLVERLDCSVSAAIRMFAQARPPGIYKQDYINELFRRYDDDELIEAPPLPAWCLEFDDSDGSKAGQKRSHNEYNTDNEIDNDQKNDNENDDGLDGPAAAPSSTNGKGAGGGSKKKRRREMIIKDAKFMDGVPGVHLVTDNETLSELQILVQEMCGWEKNGFPGAQPVSMDRKNIVRLSEQPYMVSWKADGTRYMMLIKDRQQIYFFDRNFSCFEVDDLTFLKDGKLNVHCTNTLIDGEMVLDKMDGQVIPRYLIYDIVRINNYEIGNEPYPKRLQCIKSNLIEPRVEGMKNGFIDRKSEPFSIRCKDFWDIYQSASLLSEKFAKMLTHEPDGLIFQPCNQPYTPGQCPDVFKWKPIELNSVDFRLKIVVESGMGIVTQKIGQLFVGGSDHYFARIKLTRTLKELNNKIIECTYNSQGNWEFLRERTDKTMPNSWSTAEAVLESIRNPVTQEYLLTYIEKCGYRDPMPPPMSRNVHRSHQQQLQHHQQHQHGGQPHHSNQHHHPNHQQQRYTHSHQPPQFQHPSSHQQYIPNHHPSSLQQHPPNQHPSSNHHLPNHHQQRHPQQQNPPSQFNHSQNRPVDEYGDKLNFH